jgi:hypothetical protein
MRSYLTFSVLILLSLSANIFSQQSTSQTKTTATISSVEARYEGGMFGYRKAQKGTLKFDEANNRLAFFGKDGKELFGLPYKSLVMIYPDKQSYRPTAATVAGAIPAPYGANIPFWFVRGKHNYLIVHYSDPDVEVARGTMSFRLKDKETVERVINMLAEKNGMTKRGEVYYRAQERPKVTL